MLPIEHAAAEVFAGSLARDDLARTDGDARWHRYTTADRAALPDLAPIDLHGLGSEEDLFEGYGQ